MTESSSLIKNKIETLFKGAIGSALVGTLVAIFLSLYIASSIQDYFLMKIWCFTIILIGLGRITLTVWFKVDQSKFSIKTWGKLYNILTYLFAGVWASSSLILIHKLPSERDPIFVTLLLGMASGGALSHISAKRLAQFYCISVVACHSIKTIIENNQDSYFLVAAEALYIILLFRIVSRYNELYAESYRLAVELQDKLDLEKELQKQKVQALQKSKLASLGEMAAGMAHEINNPLTISLGKLDVLNRLINTNNNIPEQFSVQIKSIIEANKRAASIVNSIRNLSRIKEESEFQHFQISELVDLVKPLILVKLGKFNINLIEEYENYMIFADKGEVSQVLLNVFNNAIDAIKNNEGKHWIKLTSSQDDEFTYIKITDSGFLVDVDDLVKIFEPFYTTKDIGEGTGLGLSLSRSIMQRNGGNIAIDTSGANTSFVINVKSSVD